MARRVFITGATGFVGLNVLRKLRRRGERVRALARPGSKGVRFVKKFGAETAPGDVTDYESVRAAVRGCERVYHVAGVTSQSPATEESKWDYAGLGLPYHETKRAGERVALGFVRRGLDVVVVNPTFMIGEWDVKPTSGQLILLASRFGIPGYPLGTNNDVDVEDAADGHLLAMERGRKGHRYILGHENLAYKELLAMVCEATGKPQPVLPLPYPLARAAGFLGDFVNRFAPEGPFSYLSGGTARLAYTDHCVSPRKAVRELGLPQRPVKAAVGKAYLWFKRYGYW